MTEPILSQKVLHNGLNNKMSSTRTQAFLVWYNKTEMEKFNDTAQIKCTLSRTNHPVDSGIKRKMDKIINHYGVSPLVA